MNSERIWVTGSTRSGKTEYLIRQFCTWIEPCLQPSGLASVPEPSRSAQPSLISSDQQLSPGVLVLAAIGDNRIDLGDRIATALQGSYPFYSTTPLGFLQDEVLLFWPLLIQRLDLKAQFPLRLAPETEQELATRLWRPELDRVMAEQAAVTEARLVRRILDLLQLAAVAGIEPREIPTRLDQGLVGQERELPLPSPVIGELLQRWQAWCLDRGFLTYSIIANLYWQHLLSNPFYQAQLTQRYQILLADDVDEYPAITRPLFEVLLNAGASAVFTYNPDGAVRLGLGADPDYLEGLSTYCRVETLTHSPVPGLAQELDQSVVQIVTDPIFFASLPDSIQAIQTISRAQLLRRTAELIVEGVRSQQVQPRDIAVIGPGFDAIARYSLIEILTKQQIPVESLNDQRPLTSSPIIRALLTLLTLVYSGLGRLVDRDAVAEMLVVLSQKPAGSAIANSEAAGPVEQRSGTVSFVPAIDPVRAGLLADHCFVPHPDRPRLLPANTFPRWDRLGYQTTTVYQEMVQWIEIQQAQLQQRLIPNAGMLLDRAIQYFLLGGSFLPYDQLSALRQFIETAQHYWEVSARLQRGDRTEGFADLTISRFIQLLRNGTVTANPYPVRAIGAASNAITLANVFQYRANRLAHRWQFWLDAGSNRWLSSTDGLFGAPLFLQAQSGCAWTASDAMQASEDRLRRILLDLLGRASERIYLCHSDLATSGQEQTGILLSLVNAAIPLSF